MEVLLLAFAILFLITLVGTARRKRPEPLDVSPEQILRDADAMCLYGHQRQAAELLELYCERFPDNPILQKRLTALHEELSLAAVSPARSAQATRLRLH